MPGSKGRKRSLSRQRRNTGVPIAFLTKVLRLLRTHRVVRNAWELRRLELRWDEEPIRGTYAILDACDGDIYIRKTDNFFSRKCGHNSLLRRDEHPNRFLQDACPDGIDNRRWRFLVLEEIMHEDEWHLRERELWWQNHVPSCINRQNDQRTAEFRAFTGR
jgi:hypothetical protein